MRISTAILAGLLMAAPPVATNAQTPPCGDRVPVPPGVKTEKADFNAFTGDSRIRLRPFKAIVFLPANRNNDDELQDALVTEEAMKRLFQAFQNKFTEDDGIERLVPFGIEHRPFTQPVVLRTTKGGEDEATWGKLAEKIGQLNIQEEDVTFLWIQTHGTNLGMQGLLQDETGAKLERSRILEMINSTADGNKPWLTVLITDRCSVPAPAVASRAAAPTRPRAEADRVGSEIWRALYFGHRGLVDIDTSGPGQAAVIKDPGGSVFLNAFMDVLNSKVTPAACLQVAPESMILWDGKFRDAVNEKVRLASPQSPQWYLSGVSLNPPMEGPGPVSKFSDPRNSR